MKNSVDVLGGRRQAEPQDRHGAIPRQLTAAYRPVVKLAEVPRRSTAAPRGPRGAHLRAGVFRELRRLHPDVAHVVQEQDHRPDLTF